MPNKDRREKLKIKELKLASKRCKTLLQLASKRCKTLTGYFR